MKKTIKVVHVIPQIGIGGAETQLYALITNSDPQAVTHEVLYYSDSRDDEGFKLYTDAGIKYTRIPRNKKRPIKFLRDLASAIKAREPDIVHCWLFSANIWGRLAAIIGGHKKIIVTFRGGHFEYSFFMRCLEFFTGSKVYHLANSRACANMTAMKTGVNPGKYDVIYNGVDLERFESPSKKEQLRTKFNISHDTKIITMVGRLTEAKNYPMLLEIARKCKAKNLHVRFLIVGHGEKEKELKEQAVKLGVNEIVDFLGIRLDVPDILTASDIFCYTSNWEGFPNALLEAMASGLAVIATDFDGVRELVTSNETGMVVPRNDADAAVDAIQKYIDDPALAERFGSNAKKSIRSNFATQLMVENTIKLYQKLLN